MLPDEGKILYPVGRTYEDVSTTYKLVRRCEKIAVIPTCLYHYIRRSGSTTKLTVNIPDFIDAEKELSEYIVAEYPETRGQVFQYLNDIWIQNWMRIAKIPKITNNDLATSNRLRNMVRKNCKYGFYRKKYYLIGLPLLIFPRLLGKVLRLREAFRS